MPTKTIYFCCLGLGTLVVLGWQVAKSNAYESAKYTVVESEKPFEIREYPELMLAATKMGTAAERDRGSFMRLFRYISGDNGSDQKVAMTTPVFMEAAQEKNEGQMGFVVPQAVVEKQIPEPDDEQVTITKRAAGKFAVIQFKGRMDAKSITKAEQSLRTWMKEKGHIGEANYESAGYDPPWKPGWLRRNEVLIRLLPVEEVVEDESDPSAAASVETSE